MFTVPAVVPFEIAYKMKMEYTKKYHVPPATHFPFTKIYAVCGLTVLLLILCVICGPLLLPSQKNAHADGSDIVTVHITGSSQPTGFFPALLTVHAYDTILFINSSSPAAPYSVIADDGSFSSPVIASGKQWAINFTSPATHEYHENAPQPRMIGEILVVADTVSLLPTPAPEAEATMIAIIKAGKTPPDTLVIPASTPVSHRSGTTSVGPAYLQWLMPVLVVAGGVLLVAGAGIGAFRLFRSRIPAIKRRWKKSRSHNNDEEDEYEYESDEEVEYEYE